MLSNVGDPSQPVWKWLQDFAKSNRVAEWNDFWWWNKAYHRGRAEAFEEAAQLLLRSITGVVSD